MTDSRIDWNNQIVEPSTFMELKDDISMTDLNNLRGALGINVARLDSIRSNNSNYHADVVYHLFLTWKQMNGRAATNGALCDALARAERGDLADDLRKRWSSSMPGSGDSITLSFRDDQTEVDSRAAVSAGATSTANDELCYKISSKSRGKCLILTYDTFKDSEDNVIEKKSREGNLVDHENLKKIFGNDCLDFDVEDHRNLNIKDTWDRINGMSKKQKRHWECFVLVVCSHGDGETFSTSDGEKIKIQDVLTPFKANNCENLAGKPKIFFFNTCRGTVDQEMIKRDNANPSGEIGVGAMTSCYTPNEADFCVVLSTVPGYYSYRDTEKGTYFVQSLCRCLESNYQKLDLIHILAITNNDLIKVFNKLANSTGGKVRPTLCQVSTIIMTLSKPVYFVT